MDLQLEDTDTLSGLEDRILRAVQLVGKLKEENAGLKERLAEAESEASLATTARNDADEALAAFRANAGKAEKELKVIQIERKQVKARIENCSAKWICSGADSPIKQWLAKLRPKKRRSALPTTPIRWILPATKRTLKNSPTVSTNS